MFYPLSSRFSGSSSIRSVFCFILDRVEFLFHPRPSRCSVLFSIFSMFCFILGHLGFSGSSAIISVLCFIHDHLGLLFRPGHWQCRRVYSKVRDSLQRVGALFSSDSSPHAEAEVPGAQHRRAGVYLRGKDARYEDRSSPFSWGPTYF